MTNETKEALLHLIVTARYSNNVEEYLEKYFSKFEDNNYKLVFNALENILDNPIKWDDYNNTEMLLANRNFFVNLVKIRLNTLRLTKNLDRYTVIKFFSDNNPYIKYATNRWAIANPGIALERFIISEDNVAEDFLNQLRKIGVDIGDKVIHLHVISNNERIELKKEKFDVSHNHWVKDYYIDALLKVAEILQSNQQVKGYFCEDSWVFDPFVHNTASDGKPYCSFTFLSDNLLVGNRYFVGDATPDGKYWKQFEFSTRSKRRKDFYHSGEYTPKTYGMFYPREELLKNVEKIKELIT